MSSGSATPAASSHFRFDRHPEEHSDEGSVAVLRSFARDIIGDFSMKMIVIVEDLSVYEQWKQSQESWLKQNPDYLKKVPAALQEAAMIKAGLQREAAGMKVAANTGQ